MRSVLLWLAFVRPTALLLTMRSLGKPSEATGLGYRIRIGVTDPDYRRPPEPRTLVRGAELRFGVIRRCDSGDFRPRLSKTFAPPRRSLIPAYFELDTPDFVKSSAAQILGTRNFSRLRTPCLKNVQPPS